MGNRFLSVKLEDNKQSFWQLAFIQGAAYGGIPALILGGRFATEHGIKSAILSIFIGNIILWLIGLAVIGMTSQLKINTIQNFERYIGKFSATAGAIFLIISIPLWYGVQLKLCTNQIESLNEFFPFLDTSGSLKIGAALGFLSAIIALKGIKLIKWVCIFSFPIIFISVGVVFFNITYDSQLVGKWEIKLNPIMQVIFFYLIGNINLPTFFRHAKSKADAFMGISLTFFIWTLLQFSTIFINIKSPSESLVNNINAIDNKILVSFCILLLIVLSCVCVNLFNIYITAATWEYFFPKLSGAKEFVIIGLIGTTIYGFFQLSRPMMFLLNQLDGMIACIGIVVILNFLTSVIVRHRPRSFEKVVSTLCWVFGSVVIFIKLLSGRIKPTDAMMQGIGVTIFAFLICIFIEEVTWSAKVLLKKKS